MRTRNGLAVLFLAVAGGVCPAFAQIDPAVIADPVAAHTTLLKDYHGSGENGWRHFEEACKRLEEVRKRVPRGEQGRLGLDPTDVPAFLSVREIDDPAVRHIRAYVVEFEKSGAGAALRRMRTAPFAYVPFPAGMSMEEAHRNERQIPSAARGLASATIARMRIAAEKMQPDEVVELLADGLALADAFYGRLTLLDSMAAMGIEQVVLDECSRLVQEGHFEEPTLAKIAKLLEDESLHTQLDAMEDGEWLRLMWDGRDTYLKPSADAEQWERFLREYEACQRELFENRTSPRFVAVWDHLPGFRYRENLDRPDIKVKCVLELLVTHRDTRHLYALRRRAAIVFVALERARLADGRYPKDLGALVPRFLDEIPTDPATGDEPVYRTGMFPASIGDFELYFKGLDRADNKGHEGRATRYDAAGEERPAMRPPGRAPGTDWVPVRRRNFID